MNTGKRFFNLNQEREKMKSSNLLLALVGMIAMNLGSINASCDCKNHESTPPAAQYAEVTVEEIQMLPTNSMNGQPGQPGAAGGMGGQGGAGGGGGKGGAGGAPGQPGQPGGAGGMGGTGA